MPLGGRSDFCERHSNGGHIRSPSLKLAPEQKRASSSSAAHGVRLVLVGLGDDLVMESTTSTPAACSDSPASWPRSPCYPTPVSRSRRRLRAPAELRSGALACGYDTRMHALLLRIAVLGPVWLYHPLGNCTGTPRNGRGA